MDEAPVPEIEYEELEATLTPFTDSQVAGYRAWRDWLGTRNIYVQEKGQIE